MYSSRKFKKMVSFQQRLGQPKVPVRHGSPTWGAQLSSAHGEALPPTLRTSVRFLLQEVVAEHGALLQAAGSQLALDVTAYSVGGLSMGSSLHRKEYICRIALRTMSGGHQRLCRCCAVEVGRSPRRMNLAAGNRSCTQSVINRARLIEIVEFCCI